MDKRIQCLLRLVKNFGMYPEFYHKLCLHNGFISHLNNDAILYNAIHTFKINRGLNSNFSREFLDSLDTCWNELLRMNHLPFYQDYSLITHDNSAMKQIRDLKELKKYSHILRK